jgi:uncharacterized protein YndB with AHSA1/START domain
MRPATAAGEALGWHSSLDIEQNGDRELVFRRSFAAPPELVFAAHTRPALVRRWLLGPPGWEMPECTIDLRVGGRYRYEWRHADGRTMGMGGIFDEIEAPNRLVAREMFDEDWTGGETVNTMSFATQNGGTLLTMSVLFGTAEAMTGALETGMTGGMENSYQALDEVVSKEQQTD